MLTLTIYLIQLTINIDF